MISFDFQQPSILRKMLLTYLGFGLGMGSIFPFFALLFVSPKEGMLGWFIVACIVAGIIPAKLHRAAALESQVE